MVGTRITGALVAIVLAGCSANEPQQVLPVHHPAFAHQAAGESILLPLVDREFEDETGQLGQGQLRLVAMPIYGTTGTFHMWMLFEDGVNKQTGLVFPVTSRGDVADFYCRLTGKEHSLPGASKGEAGGLWAHG